MVAVVPGTVVPGFRLDSGEGRSDNALPNRKRAPGAGSRGEAGLPKAPLSTGPDEVQRRSAERGTKGSVHLHSGRILLVSTPGMATNVSSSSGVLTLLRQRLKGCALDHGSVRLGIQIRTVAPALLLAALVVGAMGCTSGTFGNVTLSPEFKKTSLPCRIAVLPLEQAYKKAPEFYLVSGWFPQPNLGTMYADAFATSLMATGKFSIVERAEIKRIMDEKGLSMADFYKKEPLREIGKLLGVQQVVVGQYVLGDGFVLLVTQAGASFSLRAIDVDTGVVMWFAGGGSGSWSVFPLSMSVPLMIDNSFIRGVAAHAAIMKSMSEQLSKP